MSYDVLSLGIWVGRTDSGYSRAFLASKGLIPFYSPLDPGAAAHMAAWRLETGKPAGLYTNPHWYGYDVNGKALAYRMQIDADVARLLKPGEPVSIDNELFAGPNMDPVDWNQRLFLGSPGNRGLLRSSNTANPTGTQQGRTLRYTNMPFQGKYLPVPVFQICPELHADLQCYYSDMAKAAEASVVLEGVRWGIDAKVMHAFRDAKYAAADDRDVMYFVAERYPGMYGHLLSRERAFADAKALTIDKKMLREHYVRLAKSADLHRAIDVEDS